MALQVVELPSVLIGQEIGQEIGQDRTGQDRNSGKRAHENGTEGWQWPMAILEGNRGS